ncbi:MAG: hypothetical protein K0S45_3209 [Nitrospira sp.]|jgi:hypothetical protein|nr:hypothetical protein [Nitrospira sp.]
MQFIQYGRTYINVNRIVWIEAENKTYTVVWLDELNQPQSVRLKQEEAEAFQYLLSK